MVFWRPSYVWVRRGKAINESGIWDLELLKKERNTKQRAGTHKDPKDSGATYNSVMFHTTQHM